MTLIKLDPNKSYYEESRVKFHDQMPAFNLRCGGSAMHEAYTRCLLLLEDIDRRFELLEKRGCDHEERAALLKEIEK